LADLSCHEDVIMDNHSNKTNNLTPLKPTKSSISLSAHALIKSDISQAEESDSTSLIIATSYSPSAILIGARRPSNPGTLDMHTCTNGDC